MTPSPGTESGRETEPETTTCAECGSPIDAETLGDGCQSPLGPICGMCLDELVWAGETERLAAIEEYAADSDGFAEKAAERGPNATLADFDISDDAREALEDIKASTEAEGER